MEILSYKIWHDNKNHRYNIWHDNKKNTNHAYWENAQPAPPGLNTTRSSKMFVVVFLSMRGSCALCFMWRILCTRCVLCIIALSSVTPLFTMSMWRETYRDMYIQDCLFYLLWHWLVCVVARCVVAFKACNLFWSFFVGIIIVSSYSTYLTTWN